LTRAFASRFKTCYGVDISEGMIENAWRLNRQYPNCHFLVNTEDNLAIFPDNSFDLIYTNLVLQHIPHQKTIKSYIREFIRTLKPDGLLIFQLPSQIAFWRRLQPRRRLYAALRCAGCSSTLLYNKLGLNPMKMNFLPEGEVKAAVHRAGGLVDFVETTQTPQYQSSKYFVTRQRCVPLG
jgi:ubiquinone/menaquinone biosynthesis C-methylase UbiE